MSEVRKVLEAQMADAVEQAADISRSLDEARRHLGNALMDVWAEARIQALEPRLQEINRHISETRRDLRRLDEEDTHRQSAATAERLRFRAEDRAFWFRRFHTSLGIAHGAGFAAVGSKLFDSTVNSSTAAAAWYPMSAFALGMLLAGLIPVALFLERQRGAWTLAISSAALFVVALTAALVAVWIKAGLVFPSYG